MNTLLFPKGSKIESLDLQLFRDGIKEVFRNLIIGIAKPGLVIKEMAQGILDVPFQVTGSTAISVQAGYAMILDGNQIRVIKFNGTQLPIPSSPGTTTYYVNFLVSGVNYEPSTITLENGSDIVNISSISLISSTTTNNLVPGRYIMVSNSDSIYGNGGRYLVIASGSNYAKLSKVFTGTTEPGLKWKIGGEFAPNATPSNDNDYLIYEYDSAVISIDSFQQGLTLASLTFSAGSINTNVDMRSGFLFDINSNSANADKVRSGLINAITSIEEKTASPRLDSLVKNILTKGVLNGMVPQLLGHILTVNSGFAIDGNGKIITLTSNVNFDLSVLVAGNVILEGNNFLHIRYVSPNSYNWLWSQTISNDPQNILLYQLTYSSGAQEE